MKPLPFLLTGALLLSTAPLGWAETTVYVTSHGWHTGVVLPGDTVTGSALDFVTGDVGPGEYYEFGWGDERYYQEGEGKPWLLISAGLWPTPSVMHAVALPSQPQDYFPDSEHAALVLSDATLEALVAAIANSFAFVEGEPPEPGSNGLYGVSRFYPAEGQFHLRRTCNTWTLEVLAAAGVPVEPAGVIRAGSVMAQLQSLVHDDSP